MLIILIISKKAIFIALAYIVKANLLSVGKASQNCII